MNRFCEDCRHWTRHGASTRNMSDSQTDVPTWGKCARADQPDALFGSISESGEVLAIVTHQHFGCVQWQSK